MTGFIEHRDFENNSSLSNNHSLLQCNLCGIFSKGCVDLTTSICQKELKTEVPSATYATVLKDALSIDLYDGLEKNLATICIHCQSLIEEIDRLQLELSNAKEKIRKSISLKSSAFIDFEKIRLEVVDEGSERQEGSINFDVDVLLRITSDEKLKISSSRITTRVLNELGIYFFVEDDILIGESQKAVEFYDGQYSEQNELPLALKRLEKGLACKECRKVILNLNLLKYHILNDCQFVNKKVLKKSHLNKEESNRKPYQCDVCQKKFTRKASMLEHLARHKGTRDRECKVYSKTVKESVYKQLIIFFFS